MPAASAASPDGSLSDTARDAKRYGDILVALDGAVREIRRMRGAEKEGYPDIDEVLDRLLPDLARALNARQAFVAVPEKENDKGRWFQLTAVYPDEGLRGSLINSDLIHEVIRDEDEKARVIDSLDNRERGIIRGLEIFGATSAILVRMQPVDRARVVGICDKKDPDSGPYLAADRMAISSIVELVAIGSFSGERRRRELEAIQKTSAAISAELELDELLPIIAEGAARVFDAPATSVMLWDEAGQNMVIRSVWGLSDECRGRQFVSREVLYEMLEAAGEFELLLTPDLQCRPYGDMELIKRERLRTVITAPLREGDNLIGILNIYSRDEPLQITSYGIDIIQTLSDKAFIPIRDARPFEMDLAPIFANQAAIAIHNARLYETVTKKTTHLQTLYEASRVIAANLGVELDVERILGRFLQQAVEITGVSGKRATLGTIQTFDEQANELVFTNVYPEEGFPDLVARLGERIPLDEKKARGGRVGVTGRAALTRRAQVVKDVREDPDYIEYDPSTRSELAVPLLDSNRLVGVLNVEHGDTDVFDRTDLETLQSLADLAVMSVKNVKQAEQLSRANAVAIMGAWGAHTIHDVNREVSAIRRSLFLLHDRDDLPADVCSSLEEMDGYAEKLAMPEFPESGFPLHPRNATLLDEVVMSEVERLQKEYPSITFLARTGCTGLGVAMEQWWLRRLVGHLLHNAAEAIPGDKETRTVTVRTRVRDVNTVEVQVEDTGKGIRQDIKGILFKRPIHHPEEGHMGRGLLLVQFVAEQHGGYARLDPRYKGEGARFVLGIPIAGDGP